MKYNLRSLMIVVTLAGISSGFTTFAAPLVRADEPATFDLGAIVADIDRHASGKNRQSLLAHAARAAAGQHDLDQCRAIVERIKENYAREVVLREVLDDIAVIYADKDVEIAADLFHKWRLTDQNVAGSTAELEWGFVESLCEQGRGKIACIVAKKNSVDSCVEVRLLSGNLTEAIAYFKDQLGANNVAQAVNVAANVYRCGRKDIAASFLQQGWPERHKTWSLDLCLAVSVSGQEPQGLLNLVANERQRYAVERASERLRKWSYLEFMKGVELGETAQTYERNDHIRLATILAATIAQDNPKVRDHYVSEARDLLAKKQVTTDSDWRTRAERSSCLVKELIYSDLTFDRYSEVNEDFERAQSQVGQDAAIAYFADIISRSAKLLSKQNISRLDEAMKSPEGRQCFRLGLLEGKARLPERLPTLERHLRERMRLSFWVRVRDDLYE